MNANQHKAEPGQATAPAERRPEQQAGDSHWSPMSTRSAKLSWALLAVFTTIYFAVAILTSAEFADLAAILILGLPLGFYMGIGLIVSGLVITRIYLTKVEG
ncbi:MAG: hypothetical protein ACC726_09455 [Chloroflexota bacterium]